MYRNKSVIPLIWNFYLRYGQPASTLTDNTLSTVGNFYNIAQNAKIMTPKGLAKRTAKDTGKAMVYEYSASYRGRIAYDDMMVNGANGTSGSNVSSRTEDCESKDSSSEKRLMQS